MKYLVILSLLVGCGSLSVFKTVRQKDLDSWKGVSIAKARMNPVFSSMNEIVRKIDDRTYIVSFRNSKTYTNQTKCYTSPYGFTTCSGGDTQNVTCDNQFVVVNGLIEEYRPVGICYTDCSVNADKESCESGEQDIVDKKYKEDDEECSQFFLCRWTQW